MRHFNVKYKSNLPSNCCISTVYIKVKYSISIGPIALGTPESLAVAVLKQLTDYLLIVVDFPISTYIKLEMVISVSAIC